MSQPVPTTTPPVTTVKADDPKTKLIAQLDAVWNQAKEYAGKANYNPYLLKAKLDVIKANLFNPDPAVASLALKEGGELTTFKESMVKVEYEKSSQPPYNPGMKVTKPPVE